MMLYRNDIFTFEGHPCRLLHVDADSDRAWIISMDGKASWPVSVAWTTLVAATEANRATRAKQLPGGTSSPTLDVTPSMSKIRDAALARLGNLTDQVPALSDRRRRGQLVRKRAREAGCTTTTVNKDLRRYWRGGQMPAALLGRYTACGTTPPGGTVGRGRPASTGPKTYQLGDADRKHFRAIIERHYLKDGRVKLPATFQRLLEEHYQFTDGNGQQFVLPPGERPSLRQFKFFLYKNYSLERRLRCRLGNKDFERDHRAKIGTVLADCLGVGHYYEADATIADVYLVATHDVKQIVGKPTIYLIADRKSRLIVGWYVGLENPSWTCAMEAILSISKDKAALCATYGVDYDPEDWPADRIFPKEFLADRGELIKHASTQIADHLGITVTNVPSQRGDWKPVIECDFKQIRVALEDGTPGFDPPENAKRRQGKHYEKDASLTLRDFSAIILNGILAHNRAQMSTYQLTAKELADQVKSSPIGIWNHNIRDRAGLLTRYDEEQVRFALLPRAEATVTEEGILLNKCLYTCELAMTNGWFVQARQRRFKVLASYDTRLVDVIYVHDPDRRRPPAECTLTRKSDGYRGCSFAEVEAQERIRARLMPGIEQSRLQAVAAYHAATAPIIARAKKKLSSAGRGITRSARRADTKEARALELREERQLVAHPRAVNGANPVSSQQLPSKVIGLPVPRTIPRNRVVAGELRNAEAKATPPSTPNPPQALSIKAKLHQIRKRPTNG